MITYSHTTKVIQPTGANVVTFALGGNPFRRSVIVCARLSGQVLLFNRFATGADSAWWFILTPGGAVFPYRDFGTLITGELWVSNATVNNAINVTEIFQVPK